MTGFPRSQISLTTDLQRLLICLLHQRPPTQQQFDVFIFCSESLYIARAILYEADKYGTIDTEFRTLIYGISQEGVLGAFEELWERLQIKFTPYLGEAVKVERGVKAVKITDKEADRYAQEQAGSDYEPKVEIKSKDKKVKSGDAGNESSAQSSDDVKVMRITRKKTRAKKKFGKLMAIEHSSDDSESDRAGVVHTIRLMGSSEIV
ncbi:hypothetical protein E8E11_000702 [Didymella keratinophila]|nr:hypothetical protein E8E11_000702 [Didymella keratinophila]